LRRTTEVADPGATLPYTVPAALDWAAAGCITAADRAAVENAIDKARATTVFLSIVIS
jgi:hypothetical protein